MRFSRLFSVVGIGLTLALPSARGPEIQAMKPADAQHSDPTLAVSGEWPQYRHDAGHSGRAGEAPPAGADGALHLQWAYSLGERVEVEVEPIVAAGKLFVGAMNGTLTALNTGDANWSFIKELFAKFTGAYNSRLGFCVFPKWHVGKLGLASEIGTAAGVLRMANARGDGATMAQAQTLLNNLLATRVRLAHYMRDQYDSGAIAPLPLRIDPDGVPNRDDIFKYNDVGELIPLAGDRDRASDTRQLNWYDGSAAQTHSSAGFMHYAALVGYSPLYPELAERLRRDLLAETRQYVQSYEANAPWWWMSDLSHHTTAGGEHLWHSPTLAHDMFQTKAWVLREDWETLRRQLPLPMSINPRYDLYRLHNLATLLARSAPDLAGSSLTATPAAPRLGSHTTLTFSLNNAGGPLESTVALTVTLPPELSYLAGSARASLGVVAAKGNVITWSGAPGAEHTVTIRFDASVQTSARCIVTVRAQFAAGTNSHLARSVTLILNGHAAYVPLVECVPC